MPVPTLTVEFEDLAHLEREFEANLKHGGLFVAGASEVVADTPCQVVLVHPENESKLTLEARVVWMGQEDASQPGIAVAITGFNEDLRWQVREFIDGGTASDTSSVATDRNRDADSVHQRLRGLSVANAHRVAREGEVNERMILERIYGKIVWEPLLRNPRLTVPEVVRIARMGALPIPLLELITANGNWLGSPSIRRALLSNPRLGGELLLKVLRATPRHELKLIPKQTSHSQVVRAAARKLLGT